MLEGLSELFWSETELHDFVETALASGLGDRTRRDLLLLHLPRGIRDRFPEVPPGPNQAAGQLISDLRYLGGLELQMLGQRRKGPFKQWCENAADLVHWRFAEQLRSVRGWPNPYPPPKPKKKPKPRESGKLMALAFVVALVATAVVMGKAVYEKQTTTDDPVVDLIRMGRAESAAGNAKAAYEALNAALQKAPSDLRLRAEVAQAAFEAGQSAQAETLFEPVAKQATDEHLAGMALYYQARIREARGDLAGAVVTYRRSLEKRPSEDAKRRLKRLTQPKAPQSESR